MLKTALNMLKYARECSYCNQYNLITRLDSWSFSLKCWSHLFLLEVIAIVIISRVAGSWKCKGVTVHMNAGMDGLVSVISITTVVNASDDRYLHCLGS